jgi:hypothetical protein
MADRTRADRKIRGQGVMRGDAQTVQTIMPFKKATRAERDFRVKMSRPAEAAMFVQYTPRPTCRMRSTPHCWSV